MEWLGTALFGGVVKRFSTSTHHYLHDFVGPKKDVKSHACMIQFTLVSDENTLVKCVPKPHFRVDAKDTQHAFLNDLNQKMKPTQKALILGIQLRFVNNGTSEDGHFTIKNLFNAELNRVPKAKDPSPYFKSEEQEEQEEEQKDNEEAVQMLPEKAETKTVLIDHNHQDSDHEEQGEAQKGDYIPHTDNTGEAHFGIPGGMNKKVPKDDQCIYEPNFMNLEGFNALEYVGLEQHILHPRSSVLSGELGLKDGQQETFEVFKYGDPMAVFVLQYRAYFDSTEKDILERLDASGQSIYIISKTLLSRVRNVFKDAIFPLLHYTRFENVVLEWNAPSHEICAALYEQHKEALENKKPEDAPTIIMLLTVDYMIITPRTAVYDAKATDLGL